MWICKVCETKNEDSDLRCSCCGEPKPAPAAAPKPRPAAERSGQTVGGSQNSRPQSQTTAPAGSQTQPQRPASTGAQTTANSAPAREEPAQKAESGGKTVLPPHPFEYLFLIYLALVVLHSHLENNAPDSSLFPLVHLIFQYGWILPLALSFTRPETEPGPENGFLSLLSGLVGVLLGFWGYVAPLVILIVFISEGFTPDAWKIFLTCAACIVMHVNRNSYRNQ